MAKGFKHGAGGGGAGLNFFVVGGTTEPTNPKENTIWVNTDQKITGWVFSATEPEALIEGMVWISTGTTSSAEFNALKKNSIQVYPLSAKQYVSGAWVDKTAKSWQGGAWVDWITYLYSPGNLCEYITGGWHTQARLPIRGGNQLVAPKFTNYEDYAYVAGQPNGGGIFKTVNLVDLSEIKAIRFYGSSTDTSSDKTSVRLFVCNSSFSVIAKTDLGNKTHSPTELQFTGAGQCYVGFEIFSQMGSVTINKIELVRK